MNVDAAMKIFLVVGEVLQPRDLGASDGGSFMRIQVTINILLPYVVAAWFL